MAMDHEAMAKAIKDALDKGIDKGYKDYKDSGEEQKASDTYDKKDQEKKAKAKQDELNKKYPKKTKTSKIPKLNIVDESKRCPHCGHISCGCKFHHPTPSEPDIKDDNTITDEELNDLLNETDLDKLKEKLDSYPNLLNFNQEILDSIGKAIDDEFQKADNTLNIKSPIPLIAKGTLKLNMKSNFILNALEIGTKCAVYWSICIVPMVSILPQYMGAVTIVTNDAVKIATPIAQKLIQLSLNAKPNDDYKEMCKIIIEEVKTITWNITEVIPGSPPVTQQYTTNVS